MRRAFRSFLWCFGGVLLASLSGCGGGGTTTTYPILSAPKRFGTLEFTVGTTKATFASQETIQVTFTVKNTGAEAVTLASSIAYVYQIQVRHGDDSVWSVPPDKFATPSPATTLTLAPGETKTFTASWNQFLVQDGPVPGGMYMVAASILANTINGVKPDKPDALKANPIPIRIDGPCPGDPVFAVPGEVLVGVQPDRDGKAEAAFLSHYGSILRYDPDFHDYRIKLRYGLCIMPAIEQLKVRPEIRYAEPNGLGTLGGGAGREAG